MLAETFEGTFYQSVELFSLILWREATISDIQTQRMTLKFFLAVRVFIPTICRRFWRLNLI